jgi:hypothetical protein
MWPRPVWRGCIRLGYRHFDYALGESQRLVLGEPVDGATMAGLIAALPPDANSGDIYAMLAPERRD